MTVAKRRREAFWPILMKYIDERTEFTIQELHKELCMGRFKKYTLRSISTLIGPLVRSGRLTRTQLYNPKTKLYTVHPECTEDS